MMHGQKNIKKSFKLIKWLILLNTCNVRHYSNLHSTVRVFV